MLKISEIWAKKRNYDFRKSSFLISHLMSDFSVLNFGAYGYITLAIGQVDLQKDHFYEIAEQFLRKHYSCDDSSK